MTGQTDRPAGDVREAEPRERDERPGVDEPTDTGTDGAAGEAGADEAGAGEGGAGEAADPWASFAPPPPTEPGRAARMWRRVRRFLRHEWTLAVVASVLLAAVMTWPALRHPATTIPQDVGDPNLQAWQIAWAGHALIHDPASVWNSNTFYPEQHSLAFSDSLLGYAPLGMIGSGPIAAIIRYNLVFVLVFAFAFVGAYALVRQLGASPPGAAVAGAAFAYAPWRLAQAGHLNILSTGGIALALAMLARGHGWSLREGFVRDRVRPGWAAAGWLVAAWQMTLGFGIGLYFGYVLIAVILASAIGWLIRRPRLPWRLLLADGLGGLAFALTVLAMMAPYLAVVRAHPEARRTVDWLALFSPPLRGFLTASPESWLWGHAHAPVRQTLSWAPEMTLLPGFFLIGLATAGLIVSVWSVRQRVLLAIGVAVSVWLAMGTASPGHGRFGYVLLYHLPGFDALRTPGRLVMWTTLLLGLLAAGAVATFASRGEALVADRPLDRPSGWVRALTVVPLLAVLAEGAQHTPHPVEPAAPALLATATDPLIVLPSDESVDGQVMLWSSAGFPRMVNGDSSFTPRRQADIRETMKSFPDERSVALLRELGVRTVIALRNGPEPAPAAASASVDGLTGVTRADHGYAVVFAIS